MAASAAAEQKPSDMVSVEHLGKVFGKTEVFNDVTFGVHQSEVVAIMGPSGAGKSTLLRCVNLLEEPSEGILRVAGRVIWPHSRGGRPSAKSLRDLRRSVGMVFQTFNLFPHLTAAQNVSLAQRHVLGIPRDQAEERASSLLERVGLSARKDAYPGQCSGGEQQRVAIARALALQPRIMLFDEPTSSLDLELGLEVLSVMRELAQGGMTMIVVTHEVQFAKDVAGRVIFMADGSIVEEGPAETVLTEPSAPRTQRFLRAVLDRS